MIIMDQRYSSFLEEFRQHLQEIYGDQLVQAVIFGSQARGDSEPGSDIDIMVVLRGDVHPGEEIARTGKLTAEFSLKYNTVLSCAFVSTERFSKERSPLLLNVHREGVPL